MSSSIRKYVQDGKSECATVLDSNHKFCEPSEANSTISEDGPRIF